jgi:transcriptional regulator with XRE-family HTH domain
VTDLDRQAAGVGERIKQRRMELGMTQRELSVPGISYAYISRIESGARNPSVKALRKLATRLRTTVAWLETGDEDPALELARLVLESGKKLPTQAHALALQLLGRDKGSRRPS